MIYFDHNATTPLSAAAREAWLEATDEAWQNPSSPYRSAASVQARLQNLRERFSGRLGVDELRLSFNSGATEGNFTILNHWSETLGESAVVALSPIEHPSVIEPAKVLFEGRIRWLPIGADGAVLIEQIDLLDVSAVSMMAVNNETGMIQPWQEMAAVCRDQGIQFHCDASQWCGKLPLEGLGECAFVTGCGHKFGGPKGIGFLVAPEGRALSPVFRGGGQERGLRAGTEDVASVAAMVAALEWAEVERLQQTPAWRDAFVAQVIDRIPGVFGLGNRVERLWNTAALILPDFKSPRWIRQLEKRGFLVSSGSACATGKDGPSHVLSAMGFGPEEGERMLRVSSGWKTHESDWMELADALVEVYQVLRDEASGSGSSVISI